jgi:two-component system phosphate regulon sensor histidine kinase PhoR
MLEEIIYNLCANAVKYNREDGLVTVTTKADAEGVRLTVTDTGIGIPQQEQARIFERFYRVDKSHSRAMGGTGLGLSIVKHAVQLHQATIHIDSRLHHGTTVEVRFPAEVPSTDDKTT